MFVHRRENPDSPRDRDPLGSIPPRTSPAHLRYLRPRGLLNRKFHHKWANEFFLGHDLPKWSSKSGREAARIGFLRQESKAHHRDAAPRKGGAGKDIFLIANRQRFSFFPTDATNQRSRGGAEKEVGKRRNRGLEGGGVGEHCWAERWGEKNSVSGEERRMALVSVGWWRREGGWRGFPVVGGCQLGHHRLENSPAPSETPLTPKRERIKTTHTTKF